jgi:hypothetical protein
MDHLLLLGVEPPRCDHVTRHSPQGKTHDADSKRSCCRELDPETNPTLEKGQQQGLMYSDKARPDDGDYSKRSFHRARPQNPPQTARDTASGLSCPRTLDLVPFQKPDHDAIVVKAALPTRPEDCHTG